MGHWIERLCGLGGNDDGPKVETTSTVIRLRYDDDGTLVPIDATPRTTLRAHSFQAEGSCRRGSTHVRKLIEVLLYLPDGRTPTVGDEQAIGEYCRKRHLWPLG